MKQLLTYRGPYLIGLVLLSLLMGLGLPRLSVSHDMEAYFPPFGPAWEQYQAYKTTFGEDDLFLMIALEADSSVYDQAFQRQVRQIKRGLQAIPHTDQVRWLDDFLPRGLKLEEEWVQNLKLSPLFVNESGTVAALLLQHQPLANKPQIDAYLEAMDQVLVEIPTERIHIVGKVYFTRVLEEFIREDSGRLFVLALGMVVVLLGLLFGSWRLLLASLAVPILAISFTLGLMGWLGFQTNLFTAMIPTLILIISVSDMVHLVSGKGPVERPKRLRYYFPALLLTTLTTAIGFASLSSSEIPVFIEFGVFVAIGVLYTLLLSVVVFAWLPEGSYQGKQPLDRWLEPLVRWLEAPPRWLTAVLLLGLLAVLGLGIPQLVVNAPLISGVSGDSEIRRNADFFDQQFCGSRPISFLVESQTGAPPISLDQLTGLESWLAERLETRLIAGPSVHSDWLPMQAEQVGQMRFFGMMPERGSRWMAERIPALQAELAAHPTWSQVSLQYAGVGSMVDANTRETTRQISRGLLIALGVTLLLLAIYFRQWKEPLLALLVNVIPLLTLAGVYGLVGIELRAGTSVAFAIAFGIAIDDTMHLLSVYRQLPPGPDRVRRMIAEAGKPVLMTTLVLSCSFAALIFSQLDGIKVLGLSMVVGCLTALLADLVLLPRLLSLFSSTQN